MLENRRHRLAGLSALLIENHSDNTWHKPDIISGISIWGLRIPIHYQVNMFFLYNSHPFYILCLEIDLRKNSHLRLLQFNFHLEDNGIRDEQNDVIGWFSSICESVTSRSLLVGLTGLFNETDICSKIQDIVLALHTRIETLSIFLSIKSFPRPSNVSLEDVRKLFPRLYEAGIVVEKWLDRDEAVRRYLLTPKLPYWICSCLAGIGFWSIVLNSNHHCCCAL